MRNVVGGWIARRSSIPSDGGSGSSGKVSSSSTSTRVSGEEEVPLLRTDAPKLDAAVEEIVRTEGDYVLALRTLTEGCARSPTAAALGLARTLSLLLPSRHPPERLLMHAR